MFKKMQLNPWSPSLSKKFKQITERTGTNEGSSNFNKYGSFSEQIFGSLELNTCRCGRIFQENVRCPKCGVKCTSVDTRKSIFARITVFYPILNPLYVGMIESVFGARIIKAILRNPSSGFHLDRVEAKLEHGLKPQTDNLTDTQKLSQAQRKKIMEQKEKLSKMLSTNQSDKLMKKFKEIEMYEQLLLTEDDVDNITNLYHFRQALKWLIFDSGVELYSKLQSVWEELFVKDIPVIPAGLRRSDGTDFLTNCYDSIISIINNKQLKYDVKLHKISQIVLNMMHDSKDGVFNKTLKGKDGKLRGSITSKAVAPATMAVVIPDPTIRPYELRLCTETLDKSARLLLLHEKYGNDLNLIKTDFDKKQKIDELLKSKEIFQKDFINSVLKKYENENNPLTAVFIREPVLKNTGMSIMNVKPVLHEKIKLNKTQGVLKWK